MSKSLLQQLYDGEVYPSENIKCNTLEYRELGGKIVEEKQYFKATLSPDDWSRFDKLEDMLYERSSAYAFTNFTYGFRLGVGLMIEALANGGVIRDEE